MITDYIDCDFYNFIKSNRCMNWLKCRIKNILLRLLITIRVH